MQADLIIQGTGIVGLSLALRCAQQGYRIALIGKRWETRAAADSLSDNRYSTINRRSQALFEALGVWGSMSVQASPYTRMVVWDAQGAGSVIFEAAAIGQPDLGHVLPNTWMLEVLWQSVLENPTIHLLESRAVTFTRDAHAVSIGLEDGTLIKAPLAIAADGAHSWLRETAGIASRVKDYHQSTLVTTVTTDEPHADTAWQCFLAEGPLAFLPLADPHQNVVLWTASTAQVQAWLTQDETSISRALAHALEDRLGAVRTVAPRQSFVLRGQVAKAFVAERVALVGDAMHVIHPLAGQGLNLGIEDVASLGQVLLEAKARGIDPGHPLVLRRYARSRSTAVRKMSHSTNILNDLFRSENTGAILLRTLGLERVEKSPWLKKQLAFQAMGI